MSYGCYIPGMIIFHQTVNHTFNFVNPVNGASTKRIKGLWDIAKMKKKKKWGIHQSMIDSYLCEFMWRHRNLNQDYFVCILRDIALRNPL